MDSSEEETFLFASQIVQASMIPAVLKSAIELDLLELIKKAGPGAFVSPAELAAQIPSTANPDAHVVLDRILRLLANSNILNCRLVELPGGGVERLYALGPVCKFFTRNDDGVSLAPTLFMHQDKIFFEMWRHINDVVLEGGVAFDKAHGLNQFKYQATDPRFNNLFNQAMYEPSIIIMKKILEIYKGFEGLKSVVDIGGGIGASLQIITSKYPSIRAINFDLPHVIQNAPPYPGIEHIGGDMFVSVPEADAIFMKWITHNWTDAHCQKLFKTCYKALPENGKLIVAESILPDDPKNGVDACKAILLDVCMLALTPGGKQRTEKEFQALANQAGFKRMTKICCVYGIWIMEFHK